MFILLAAAALLSVSHSADNPWLPITRGVQTISFPIKETQLQIKSYRPPDHETDPDYSSGVVDKSTSMVMMLLLKGTRVATIVWNTVPYKEGRDVTIFGCQVTYKRYNSNPCNGEREQVWTWQFTPEKAILKCFDEVQYEMDFSSTTLPYCKAVARANADGIKFTNMAGFSYRALPEKSLVPEPSSQEEPQDLTLADHSPTCGCWNHECGFCSDLDCTVKYDVSGSSAGVTVRSELLRSKTVFKKIMLFNGAGERIGFFMLNRRAVFLEGCIYTRSPRLSIPRGESGDWTFSLVNGVLKVEIGGVAVIDKMLRRECAEYYSDVQYFSFKRMGCEDSFKILPEVMELGTKMSGKCPGQCVE